MKKIKTVGQKILSVTSGNQRRGTCVAPTARTYGLEAGNRGEYPHLDRSPLARNDDTPSSTVIVVHEKI